MNIDRTDRFLQDGKVAVLYSPGYGAGWSTWNTEHKEFLLFNKRLVQAVLDNNRSKAARIAESHCKDIYAGGADDLRIMWLDPNDKFRVQEYDGSERIELLGEIDFEVA